MSPVYTILYAAVSEEEMQTIVQKSTIFRKPSESTVGYVKLYESISDAKNMIQVSGDQVQSGGP